MLIFGVRNTGKENDRLSKGKSDDDKERLKGQEKKGNRKYLHLVV